MTVVMNEMRKQAGHSASAHSRKASSLAPRLCQPVQPSLASQAAKVRFSTMSCLLCGKTYD